MRTHIYSSMRCSCARAACGLSCECSILCVCVCVCVLYIYILYAHAHRRVAGRQLCASRLRAFLRMLQCRHRYGMLLVALKALARVTGPSVAASIELYEIKESCERANNNGKGSESFLRAFEKTRRGFEGPQKTHDLKSSEN